MTKQQIKQWEGNTRTSYRNGKLSRLQIRLLQEACFRFEVISKKEKARRKKVQLLELAKSGKPRPYWGNDLGDALLRYTTYYENRSNYDAEFDKEIRALRPDWFRMMEETKDKARKRKILLLEMARNGSKKPDHHKKEELSFALAGYTRKGKSSYDPEFDAEIRRLRPDWFTTRDARVSSKKEQLLEMAKRGDPKPNCRHPLVCVFRNYTDRKNQSYDEVFTQQLFCLRPDWFQDGRKLGIMSKEDSDESSERVKGNEGSEEGMEDNPCETGSHVGQRTA